MLGFRSDFDAVSARIGRLAARCKDLTPVARNWGGFVVRRIRGSLLRLGPDEPSPAGGFPATRSGNRGLVGRLTFNVLAGGAGVEIGTTERRDEVIHSGTQEALGGPIVPVRAKALTIPITPAARRKRARDFHGLVLIPPRRGADRRSAGVLALVKGRGDRERIEPQYALRTAVTIPPRPFLEITPPDEAELERMLGEQLDREMRA